MLYKAPYLKNQHSLYRKYISCGFICISQTGGKNMPINYKAEITSRDIKKSFSNDKVVLVTLDMSYPEIKLKDNSIAQNRINRRYQLIAKNFYTYVSTTLVKNAQKEYEGSIENDFPFRPYDAVMKYTVTMNENCHLSTYFDRYEYTGGAHGNTIRISDSWDLKTGKRIEMQDLFKPGYDYKEAVIKEIVKLAEVEYEKNPYLYFDNYKELIAENFDEKNFNLKPKTLSVYFQQYAIGPYVSGIIVFELPYASVGAKKPCC